MSVQFIRFPRRNRGTATCLLWMSALIVVPGNDAKATPAAPTETVTSPSVSSSDQRGGVTANTIGRVYQTVLPSLVRGPQLQILKATYSEGAKIYRVLRVSELTDAQSDELCNRGKQWADKTFAWLQTRISEYAAERFAFQPPGLPMIHSKKSQCLTELAGFVNNLDLLMRDPSIYPEPS